MPCPLCGSRRARRACPARGDQICTVCCGTKRLVQIHCPSDCVYLATSREHPAAATLRRQQRDMGVLVQSMRDLSERQADLLLLIVSFLMQYGTSDLLPLIDGDVVEAAAALASTSETAARGVIYEHRPASAPAGRLAADLQPLLAKAGKGGGTAFDRDAAVVLRRIEEAARQGSSLDPGNQRAFLDLLSRVLPQGETGTATEAAQAPRLIVS